MIKFDFMCYVLQALTEEIYIFFSIAPLTSRTVWLIITFRNLIYENGLVNALEKSASL